MARSVAFAIVFCSVRTASAQVTPAAAIVPPDADAGKVAEAIVAIVDAPFGKRPFRVHVDPTQDGADVTFTVMDRVRAEMLHRVGLPELLSPVKAK